MPNLQVYKTLHVPFARQGEAMLFIALAAYRIELKHENFQVPNVQIIDDGFEKVIAAFIELSAKPSGRVAMTREDWSGATDKLVNRLVRDILKKVCRRNRQKRLGEITINKERMQLQRKREQTDVEKVNKWLSDKWTITKKRNDAHRAGQLLKLFKAQVRDFSSGAQTWSQALTAAGIETKFIKGAKYHYGLSQKNLAESSSA